MHHKAIVIKLKLTYTPRPLSAPIRVFNFHSADYENLNRELIKVDWVQLFSNITFEESIAKFYNILNDLMIKFIPLKTKTTSSRPVWYSRPLIKLLAEKRKYHSLWKRYGNQLDYESFKILRKRAIKLESECYNKYITYSEEKIKSNPKYFWTYI